MYERYQYNLSALELRQNFQNARFEAIEQKAQLAISLSALTLALMTGFSLLGKNALSLAQVFSIVAMIFCAITIIQALRVLKPRKWQDGLEVTIEDDHLNAIFESTDHEYFNFLFKTYLGAIGENEKSLQTKTDLLWRTWIALAIQFILICFAIATNFRLA